METAEQLIVGGRVLGPGIWLGGPLWASLPIHAAFCIVTTWLLARSARSLVKTTLLVLRIIRAIATFAISRGIFVPVRGDGREPCKHVPLLCQIGERAPPAMLAYNR